MDRMVAIVTGASSGIGRATALRLVDDGYALHLIDSDEAGLSVTADRVGSQGGSATTWVVDLLDRERLDRAARAILATDTPDLLVNVAGIGVAERADETSWETWDRMVGVNVSAVYRLSHLVAPGMTKRGHGSIVNVASTAALVGLPNRAAYCATKGAVLALTRAMACDYAPHGVRVNAICPGTVASEWIEKIIAGDPDPVARRAQMSARQLDGRMGTPEEVAEGIAFLASERGRFMNGAGLVMDGGMTAV